MTLIDWVYTDMGDYIRINSYTGDSKNIIVPNEICHKPTKLKSIDASVIPNIKTIESFIVLPRTDGSKVELETKCLMISFKDNQNLRTVNLSGLDTSQVVNMYGMFSGCCNLNRINLSGINTAKVKDMRNMFAVCTKLKYLDISSFDTSSLEFPENMFCYNSSLQFLRMDNFDTKLFDISKIFSLFFELYQVPLLLVTNDRRLLNYKGIAGYPFNRVAFSRLPVGKINGILKEKIKFGKVCYTTEEFENLFDVSYFINRV